ncbi:hypothetical protein [Saccharopolyspora antimicrobica]|uniref:Terminase small subunit n=1 Tax=Saccharopolyspora antimicrobica TaxID=455193 RepID=A0ABX9T5L6_9PSEU|nr:hypothetical protein [Saccharopolyspora antimicrobica]RKT82108.1 hypothetical protein ATL45_0351 [Saccharopolyspora antimicrobica]
MAQRAPKNLGSAGQRLWKGICSDYELRPDELAVLESACREADLIQRLEDALKDVPLIVKGSMGQEVASPLVTEIRQHRSTQASLLKQLKIPDLEEEESDDTGTVRKLTRSEVGRKAANARWGKR